MSFIRRKSKVKESPSTSAQGCVEIPNKDPYLLEYRESLTAKVSQECSNLFMFVCMFVISLYNNIIVYIYTRLYDLMRLTAFSLLLTLFSTLGVSVEW